jgi:predicted transcriptional regulator
MKAEKAVIDVAAIRSKLEINQPPFWARLGVTQSGGARYENGRNMPRPVQELVRLVYVENVDIKKIKREDMDVVEYLRAEKPTLFKELKKEAKAAAKEASA